MWSAVISSFRLLMRLAIRFGPTTKWWSVWSACWMLVRRMVSKSPIPAVKLQEKMMRLPTLKLTRYEMDGDGTFGSLEAVDGSCDAHAERVWDSLERPWRADQPFKSCIRSGLYFVRLHESPKHGACLLIEGGNVFAEQQQYVGHHRYAILIHPANWAIELAGCIALGKTTGTLDGKPAVLNSRQALEEVRQWVASAGNGVAQLWILWA